MGAYVTTLDLVVLACCLVAVAALLVQVYRAE